MKIKKKDIRIDIWEIIVNRENEWNFYKIIVFYNNDENWGVVNYKCKFFVENWRFRYVYML